MLPLWRKTFRHCYIVWYNQHQFQRTSHLSGLLPLELSLSNLLFPSTYLSSLAQLSLFFVFLLCHHPCIYRRLGTPHWLWLLLLPTISICCFPDFVYLNITFILLSHTINAFFSCHAAYFKIGYTSLELFYYLGQFVNSYFKLPKEETFLKIVVRLLIHLNQMI